MRYYSEPKKRALVTQFGGGCQRCGYNRSLRALQFHHTDAATKEQKRTDLKEVTAYPDRFSLLCANCHFEEHEARDLAKLVYIACIACGAPFPGSPAEVERKKYCSQKCQFAWRRVSIGDTSQARFWAHVDKTSSPAGCWLWTGYAMPDGSGQINVLRATGRFGPVLCRRFAYEMVHGKLATMDALVPRCTTQCVNPEHMERMPRKMVPARMAELGRTARGARVKGAVLTEALVLEARALYAKGGLSQIQVADALHQPRAAIKGALSGARWRYLPGLT